ncbi:MAG: hypothetical protein IPN17_02505 [Deltaproteobacteria bacterium]|nr:hypothetical protein [Deltaproteobacteria bacterium]
MMALLSAASLSSACGAPLSTTVPRACRYESHSSCGRGLSSYAGHDLASARREFEAFLQFEIRRCVDPEFDVRDDRPGAASVPPSSRMGCLRVAALGLGAFEAPVLSSTNFPEALVRSEVIPWRDAWSLVESLCEPSMTAERDGVGIEACAAVEALATIRREHRFPEGIGGRWFPRNVRLRIARAAAAGARWPAVEVASNPTTEPPDLVTSEVPIPRAELDRARAVARQSEAEARAAAASRTAAALDTNASGRIAAVEEVLSHRPFGAADWTALRSAFAGAAHEAGPRATAARAHLVAAMGPVVDRIVADATTHALRFAALEVLQAVSDSTPTEPIRVARDSLRTSIATVHRDAAASHLAAGRFAAARLHGRVARELGLEVDVAAADDALVAFLQPPVMEVRMTGEPCPWADSFSGSRARDERLRVTIEVHWQRCTSVDRRYTTTEVRTYTVREARTRSTTVPVVTQVPQMQCATAAGGCRTVLVNQTHSDRAVETYYESVARTGPVAVSHQAVETNVSAAIVARHGTFETTVPFQFASTPFDAEIRAGDTPAPGPVGPGAPGSGARGAARDPSKRRDDPPGDRRGSGWQRASRGAGRHEDAGARGGRVRATHARVSR